VVSMLSLDLRGAFDNVSHERLLWVMDKLGLPQWIAKFVASFLQGRRTRILQSGALSDWIPTSSGVPQGSTLSPILFLLFISELLTSLQNPAEGSMAFGFVDDTNLVAWGPSAESNCRVLERAHDVCVTWAYRYGAKFAPEKYHLIHFTRKRKDPQRDLRSCIKIDGHEIPAETSVRVLGVQVDSKLQWKEHIQRTAIKGQKAFEALSRITASTWGPSVQRSRLIYSAVVRPAMLYGVQVWGVQESGNITNKTALKPLKKIQNQCLRRVMGAYKRTPTAILEREAQIMPIDLHIDLLALQRAVKIKNHPVTKEIDNATKGIWSSLQNDAQDPHQRRHRGRPKSRQQHPPDTGDSLLRTRAEERVIEMLAFRQHQADSRRKRTTQSKERQTGQRPLETTLLVKWAGLTWRKQWILKKQNQTAATWNTPWNQKPIHIYSNLPKYEATALFLLRSEVIGLNSWLASINVPDIAPACHCGWPQQTVRHVLLFCPRYAEERAKIQHQAGSTDLNIILYQQKGIKAATKWITRSGLLPQFTTAVQIEKDDGLRESIPGIDDWPV